MPEHGYYVFARIAEREAPIAHVARESWAKHVARLVSQDDQLDPAPECHVVASSDNVDWLLWDREMRDIEESISLTRANWMVETGADLPRDAMLSPDTRPPINLSPIERSMVVADLLAESLPDWAAANPVEELNGGGIEASVGRVPKLDGWTRAELITQANHDDAEGLKTLSPTTFDRIRVAARVSAGEQGGRGQQRRFSMAELRKLITAAETVKSQKRRRIAAAWRDLLQ